MSEKMIERVAQRMRGIAGWMPPNLSESEWRMLARAAIAAIAAHEAEQAGMVIVPRKVFGEGRPPRRAALKD